MEKKERKKVTLADMKKTKIGPLGYMGFITACCIGYMIFISPIMKERTRKKFEGQANVLLKQGQLQDREQLEETGPKL